MELFIQLIKTPGLGQEIQQEILIQKNKKNIILELNKHINDSLETIKGEYVEDFTQEEEEKLCESIEEWDKNCNYFKSGSMDGPYYFQNILLDSITGVSYINRISWQWI